MAERKLTRDFNSEFPSNSNKEKKEAIKKKEEPEKKKLEPLAKGKINKRKKSFGKRFLESFLGDDSSSIGDYLINDIFVPALKNTISDLVDGGKDMLLFGERRGRSSYRNDGRRYTNYSAAYSRDNYRRDGRRDLSRDARLRHDFNDITFDTQDEAEDILSYLIELIAETGAATVADYYELSNVAAEYTDEGYGWTNLGGASTGRTRDGYVIKFPRTKPLR